MLLSLVSYIFLIFQAEAPEKEALRAPRMGFLVSLTAKGGLTPLTEHLSQLLGIHFFFDL